MLGGKILFFLLKANLEILGAETCVLLMYELELSHPSSIETL